MKRILFVMVVMAILGTTNVNAQDVKFGAKAGINLAHLRGERETSNIRTSVHFGLVAEYKFNEQFAIQPELLYSGQGGEEKGTLIGADIKITNKLDYLNLPVMFKYYVTERFSLQAGPQLGILLSSKVKASKGSSSAEEDIEGVKSVDFGFNLGLGFKVNKNLFFDARYNLGLNNIAEEGDAKNGTFQISVGYMF